MRLLQPLDIATFSPLKLGWKTAILEWHRQNSYKILNKEWFSPVLDGACDLYPWNPENTDFKMSLKNLARNAPSRNPSMTISYKTFEETVGSKLSTELKVREEKNEAEPALMRRIDALEETSSEELELLGSNGLKMHNQEVYISYKEKPTSL